MKVCLIKQHAGLGDILFCLKIARNMIQKGYYVIWPVITQYKFISDYIKIKNLYFADEKSDFPYKHIYNSGIIQSMVRDDFVYMPLQTADVLYPDIPIMESKYRLAKLPYQGWEESIEIIRNKEKEDSLYYDIHDLKDNEEYIFFNSIYGSPPHSKKLENMEKIYDDLSIYNKLIKLKYLDGFNPFDWIKIIEDAKEIHTADTCFICIMETLDLNATNINMYSRRPYDEFLYHLKPYFMTQWEYKEQ